MGGIWHMILDDLLIDTLVVSRGKIIQEGPPLSDVIRRRDVVPRWRHRSTHTHFTVELPVASAPERHNMRVQSPALNLSDPCLQLEGPSDQCRLRPGPPAGRDLAGWSLWPIFLGIAAVVQPSPNYPRQYPATQCLPLHHQISLWSK